MNLIGLTGGGGMGKSTAADLLRQRGLPVVDTDVLAREVVEPGQPALEEIRRLLGDEVIDERGCLRRDEVARQVFANETLRGQLEAITHPRIRERWLAQADQWRREGQSRCVVVIPLLFEVKAESELDTVICVACSAATQRRRLLGRGWSTEQVEQRIHAQWPVEQKMARAHFVIWTEGGIAVHTEQLDRILKMLGGVGI
jgi:dephospho-CoA kinase